MTKWFTWSSQEKGLLSRSATASLLIKGKKCMNGKDIADCCSGLEKQTHCRNLRG